MSLKRVLNLNQPIRAFTTLGTMSTRPSTSSSVPNAVDTHCHVFELDRFPVSSKAAYKPPNVPARKLQQDTTQKYRVVVHPSAYGVDNEPVLQAVQDLGTEETRAVVVFDPDNMPSEEQVMDWSKRGARGVRINLASVGSEPDEKELERIARAHASLCHRFAWAIDFHVHLSQLAALKRIGPRLKSVALHYPDMALIDEQRGSNRRRSLWWTSVARRLD
jgi:predicted TIM-barrel fold metal-dependent hydrolase